MPADTDRPGWRPTPTPTRALPGPAPAYGPGSASPAYGGGPQPVPLVRLRATHGVRRGDPPKTNGLAIASLICSCAGLFFVPAIPGIVLGFVARSQIKRSNGAQRGDGLAIAGIIVGFGWLVLLALGIDRSGARNTTSSGIISSMLAGPRCGTVGLVQLGASHARSSLRRPTRAMDPTRRREPSHGRALADARCGCRSSTGPRPIRDDWAVAKTRLTGICGSDAKMVFMDFGDDFGDSALNGYFSFPTVFGHEVVADVVEVGPAVTTLEVGPAGRPEPVAVVRAPGHRPAVPVVPGRRLQPVLALHRRARSHRASTRAPRRTRPAASPSTCPAHESMLIPVPDGLSDEVAVIGDPFAVSLHSVTRHPPPPGGKVLVYGGGALGSCADGHHPGALPRRRGHGRGALAGPGRPGPAARRDRRRPLPGRASCSRRRRRGPAASCRSSRAARCPMAHPGGIDVVYDTVGTAQTAEIGVRLLKARGTMVKSGVHAPERWEWSPLYFKEISWVGSNAFGVEEVDGVRMHGIAHYLRLADEGRIDMTGMLTHTFRLEQWREAFTVLANQEESGAIKVAFDFR